VHPASVSDLLAPLGSGEGVVFLLLSIGVLAMALFCMTRRNPVTAVMSLVATFFGLAGIYAMLSAHFLAVLQVLVYAGAIMVLFIFVVMILNREESTLISLRGLPTRVLGVAGGLYLSLVFCRIAIPSGVASPAPIPETFGTVAAIGNVLFRDFVFPFEAISVLLLVAVVGGVTVSRSDRKAKDAVDAAEKRIAIGHRATADYPEAADTIDDAEHDAHAAGGHH
jgi:NADH-quinone oxidoreductase subunit J